jgi:hypothetical protein
MTVLDPRASLLQEHLRRERWRQQLRDIVLEAFEVDPQGKARTQRSVVYSYVARRLDRVVNNDLCNDVRDAMVVVPGIYATVSDGRTRFRGLRLRAQA